ncbi:cell surface protein [Weissella koreensis]|uniref:cell surface protein n=1 Tax=Weissella koreensis TaxID=165096 RepID=UPI003EE344B2
MNKIKELWTTTLWFKVVIILIAIFIAYSLPSFAVFIGFIGLIYSFISYIRKLLLKKKTKFNPNYLLLAGLIFIIIGSSNPAFHKDTTNQNEPISSSSSIKKSKAESESKVNSESKAKASSESKARSESKAKATSESKAKSESQLESESIASSESTEESQRIVNSESAASSSVAAAASQVQQVQVQSTPSSSGGSRTGSHWAIQDGYDWSTRKGHSHIIPAGGALPAGYHWEVAQ